MKNESDEDFSVWGVLIYVLEALAVIALIYGLVVSLALLTLILVYAGIFGMYCGFFFLHHYLKWRKHRKPLGVSFESCMTSYWRAQI
jgi:hypothetical protein